MHHVSRCCCRQNTILRHHIIPVDHFWDQTLLPGCNHFYRPAAPLYYAIFRQHIGTLELKPFIWTPPSFAITSTPSRKSSPTKVWCTINTSTVTGHMLLIFSSTVLTPKLVRVFPSTVTTFASLGLHKQHTDLHINIFEHPRSTWAMHLHPSTSSLTGNASMFTCLGRRPALASFPLCRLPGIPMQSDRSFDIWSTVTFSTIIKPSCPSSLHVHGCSHYPHSWGWIMDSISSFSHFGQQSPPWHLHMVTRPLWQFGLQVYGLQPGWFELSHRVNLMSVSIFTDVQSCYLTCCGNPATNAQAIHFSGGLSPTWQASLSSAARNSSTVSLSWSHRIINCSNATTMNTVVRVHLISPISALCWVANTQWEPHLSTSMGECAQPFLHLLACRSFLLAQAIL